MHQVTGAHRPIDIEKSVHDMKLYAFAGLGVFDVADTCESLAFGDSNNFRP